MRPCAGRRLQIELRDRDIQELAAPRHGFLRATRRCAGGFAPGPVCRDARHGSRRLCGSVIAHDPGLRACRRRHVGRHRKTKRDFRSPRDRNGRDFDPAVLSPIRLRPSMAPSLRGRLQLENTSTSSSSTIATQVPSAGAVTSRFTVSRLAAHECEALVEDDALAGNTGSRAQEARPTNRLAAAMVVGRIDAWMARCYAAGRRRERPFESGPALARRPARHFRQPGVLRLERPMLAPAPLPFRRIARARGLIPGHQLVLSIPDEIGATHAPQCLAQHRPVVGVVIAQERLVQPALLDPLRDHHLFTVARHLAQRILAACDTSRWRWPSGPAGRPAPGRRGSRSA